MKTTTIRNSPAAIREKIAELRVPCRYWTSDEYYRALSLGLFHEEERIELIEGQIVNKMSHDPKHLSGIDFADAVLSEAFTKQNALVRVQATVSMIGDSEPEPDVSIVRGNRFDYRKRHALPADVLLLVEVSRTTLEYDRDVKAPLYARHNILEYWILNVRDNQLEVYRDAETTDWAEKPTFILRAGDTIAPLAAPESPITVADLLPDAADEMNDDITA